MFHYLYHLSYLIFFIYLLHYLILHFFYSFKLLINLKNVIPKEKISHFSGINYPISYYPIIYLINSGAI